MLITIAIKMGLKRLGLILNFSLIAFLAIFLFAPKTFAESNIVINEIMYDLPGTDIDHEWIEIYNAGSSEIDLTDFKFNDGDGPTNHALNIPPKNGSRGSIIIPAGGYLILTGNASTTILDMPNYSDSIIDTVMNLNNTLATLKILDKDGVEITSASYLKSMGANGNGKTLSWNGTAFKESSADNGTPGEINKFLSESNPPNAPSQPSPSTGAATESASKDTSSLQPAFSNFSDKILINEFMPWPDPPAGGGQNEWAELINLGNETIDLSGWQIDDGPDESSPQIIPAGALIKPGDYFLVQLSKNILNNEGDEIRLLWPDSQTVHSVTFSKPLAGASSSRFEKGSPRLGEAGVWLWTENLTPGQANIKPAPKTKVSAGQPKITIPLVAALSESVNEPKNESGKIAQTPKETNQSEENIILPEPGTTLPNLPTNESQSEFKNSRPNTWLILVSVIVASILTGVTLVLSRQKKQ